MCLSQNNFGSVKLDIFYKKKIPFIAIGDKIKILSYLELPKSNEKKERIQKFEGIVIAKHLKSTNINATITVRKTFRGGGSEKVFVLNSPWIKTIQILNHSVVRRAKLYYLRERSGKSARLKQVVKKS